MSCDDDMRNNMLKSNTYILVNRKYLINFIGASCKAITAELWTLIEILSKFSYQTKSKLFPVAVAGLVITRPDFADFNKFEECHLLQFLNVIVIIFHKAK